ncbi:MAG: hypothetical protein KAS32_25650 [Candidatus Peribacteraceae bacterium]|nr:hypothetical protein [Candidatus Peribacteraceae bacterium]
MLNYYYQILIDVDGTLAGHTKWTGIFSNTMALFRTGLLMDVPIGTWSILTSRPRIDYLFIKAMCSRYKLKPKELITSDTFFYEFSGPKDVANWKSSMISDKLSNDRFLKNIIYVDDDAEIRSMMLPIEGLIVCEPNLLINKINELEQENLKRC